MGIIRNATEGIYPYQPYQKALWDKISQGGFKQGQIAWYYSGRQTGKSMLNAIYDNNLCKEITLDAKEYIRELKISFGNLVTGGNKQRKKVKQYKFSRANWYVAEFDWVRHAEVLEWCKQQFGPHPTNPDAWSRWYNKYSEKIHFRDAKDYEWFVLRWS
jgi:hypothetical protein